MTRQDRTMDGGGYLYIPRVASTVSGTALFDPKNSTEFFQTILYFPVPLLDSRIK